MESIVTNSHDSALMCSDWLEAHLRTYALPLAKTVLLNPDLNRIVSDLVLEPEQVSIHKPKSDSDKGTSKGAKIIFAALKSWGVDESKIKEFALFLIGCADIYAGKSGKSGEGVKGVHNSIVALRNRMRERNRSILLLPGRDTWPWAVMAAQRGIPFLHDPSISRKASLHKTFSEYTYRTCGDLSRYLIFDTGFVGSIPEEYKKLGSEVEFALMSYYKNMDESAKTGGKRKILTTQIFPRMSGARSTVLNVESYPKYFKRGIAPGVQYPESFDSILKVALLTCHIWYGGMKPGQESLALRKARRDAYNKRRYSHDMAVIVG